MRPQPQELQKQVGISVFAILFMLAPLGNLLLSFSTSGISDWYMPITLWQLVTTVTAVDWIWLNLLFVTGILLFQPHKTSWSFAIITLLIVLCLNVYRGVESASSKPVDFFYWQVGFSSFVTVAMLMLAFHFRFPYLDRRAQWLFATAHRFDIRTPVQIVAQDIFEGVTQSLSASGARIHVQRDMGEKIKGLRFVDVIFSEIKNVKIKSQIVEYQDNILRVKFKELSLSNKELIRDWLRSQVDTL